MVVAQYPPAPGQGLLGQSRAGKSRTAYEVAARELAGWRLLVPKDRASLTELADLAPPPGQGQRVLVWLDDLEQYLDVQGVRGLDAALLARWAAGDPPVKVLGTIRLGAAPIGGLSAKARGRSPVRRPTRYGLTGSQRVSLICGSRMGRTPLG